MVDGGVADPSGWLVYSDRGVQGKPAQMQGGMEMLHDLTFALPVRLDGGSQVVGSGTSVLLSTRDSFSRRSVEGIWTRRFQRTTGVALSGQEIVPGPALPTEGVVNRGALLGQAGDALSFFVGEGCDLEERSSIVPKVWVSTWEVSSGLPEEVDAEVAPPTLIGDMFYLPTAVWEESEQNRSYVRAMVHSSRDGVSWELMAEVQPGSTADGGQGTYIDSIADVNGTAVGLGRYWDSEKLQRAATFTFADGSIVVHPVPEAGAGSYLEEHRSANGEVRAELRGSSGRLIHVSVAADGSVDEVYRSTEQEQRGLSIDLGDGVLLAAGWMRQPGTGIGACLWASADGGEHWDPTMLPEHEGRFPDLILLRDGEDVVALSDDMDGPRGYRLVNARAAITGEPAASDGGGGDEAGGA